MSWDLIIVMIISDIKLACKSFFFFLTCTYKKKKAEQRDITIVVKHRSDRIKHLNELNHYGNMYIPAILFNFALLFVWRTSWREVNLVYFLPFTDKQTGQKRIDSSTLVKEQRLVLSSELGSPGSSAQIVNWVTPHSWDWRETWRGGLYLLLSPPNQAWITLHDTNFLKIW